MADEKTVIGAEEIKDMATFAAALNGQFKKYNELLTTTVTKDEMKLKTAELILENKKILESLKTEGDAVEEMKKKMNDLNETIKIQGETLTKMKTFVGSGSEKMSFKSAAFKQLNDQKEGLEAFANEKSSRFKMEISTKDLAFTGTYGAGAGQNASMPFTVPQYPDREMFDVRMIVPTGTIDQPKLTYPQERAASRTNNSTWTTENAEGTKSEIGFTMATANATYYKDHFKISRFALRDVNWLAGYMQNTLLNALIAKLNTGVIADDGTSNTLSGLLANANSFDGSGAAYAGKFANADNHSVMAAARADLLKTYKRTANTVMLDPIDAAILSDARTTIGSFLNNPFAAIDGTGLTRLIGAMKLVETADITDGDFLVADIQPSTVQLLFNGPIEILMSDSDDDNFTKDLITMKIGANVMLPIYNTNAFLTGTLATVLGNIKVS